MKTRTWDELSPHQREIIFVRTRIPLSQSATLVLLPWIQLPEYIQDELFRIDWDKVLGTQSYPEEK